MAKSLWRHDPPEQPLMKHKCWCVGHDYSISWCRLYYYEARENEHTYRCWKIKYLYYTRCFPRTKAKKSGLDFLNFLREIDMFKGKYTKYSFKYLSKYNKVPILQSSFHITYLLN